MIRISMPNLDKVARDLSIKTLKQIPFAAAQALNDTANQFQTVEREHVSRTMTVRQKTFILNSIKIARGARATKERLSVVVAIDPQRNQLAKHEEGGEKHSIQGKDYVAIPTEPSNGRPGIRRTKRGLVPRSLYPSKFKPFVEVGGKVTGQERSFIVPTKGGKRLLLQRYGGKRGRHGVRALYLFAPSVTIDPSLDYLENAKEVARVGFRVNFHHRLLNALRTAR